ncbi:hypothetical protein HBHAL_1339 [Halobacillus halophilus DSM 2266]|uniref:Uncharacterized protein n=1 Tax=Halobacillus halophilus (strain ATCC 35676 / DSM 2266 / JCM 20832 / KCTC 3685 / LMG 17431 / NBRC 102448 / NCIMB 2269) TaxID=866895 RepID=I0JHU5_HALH3|nr:hypothetical protein HBHAL_1339 [Halobacillus halophilus DSM 2266]
MKIFCYTVREFGGQAGVMDKSDDLDRNIKKDPSLQTKEGHGSALLNEGRHAMKATGLFFLAGKNR